MTEVKNQIYRGIINLCPINTKELQDNLVVIVKKNDKYIKIVYFKRLHDKLIKEYKEFYEFIIIDIVTNKQYSIVRSQWSTLIKDEYLHKIDTFYLISYTYENTKEEIRAKLNNIITIQKDKIISIEKQFLIEILAEVEKTNKKLSQTIKKKYKIYGKDFSKRKNL